ncbi:hypothetical protein OV203_41170 [Nannocystis sp. ILAH1]|uniref:hypothetical protein n=1 Tax=Nannocystis sp. ILAH1 TaxID=2996789 RepID=UPI002270A967|nr:hypothetical protein [Nannocystis sp. ILAH1]MCY0993622.1 hypothetical protein [Nannocystis sp. ILAH1]
MARSKGSSASARSSSGRLLVIRIPSSAATGAAAAARRKIRIEEQGEVEEGEDEEHDLVDERPQEDEAKHRHGPQDRAGDPPSAEDRPQREHRPVAGESQLDHRVDQPGIVGARAQQLAADLECLPGMTALAEHEHRRPRHVRGLGVGGDQPREAVGGGSIVALDHVQDGVEHLRGRVVGSAAQGLGDQGAGLVELKDVEEQPGVVGEGVRIGRVVAQPLEHDGLGFGVALVGEQDVEQERAGAVVPGRPRERLVGAPLGLCALLLRELDAAREAEGVRIGRVERERLADQCPRAMRPPDLEQPADLVLEAVQLAHSALKITTSAITAANETTQPTSIHISASRQPGRCASCSRAARYSSRMRKYRPAQMRRATRRPA